MSENEDQKHGPVEVAEVPGKELVVVGSDLRTLDLSALVRSGRIRGRRLPAGSLEARAAGPKHTPAVLRTPVIVVNEPVALDRSPSTAADAVARRQVASPTVDRAPVPASFAQPDLEQFASREDVARVWRTVTDLTRWALSPVGLFSGSTDQDQLFRQLLLLAAATAREAFLRSGNRAAVADFAFGWLNLRPAVCFRDTTLDAVVQVLLAKEWCELDVRHDNRPHAVVLKRFRGDVHDAHRSWKWIGQTKLRGASIGSLNVPVLDGGGTELGDLVSGADDVESAVFARWGDPAVRGPVFHALARFTAQEREAAWLAASGKPWNEAAEIVGLGAGAGKNLRRRLQRITSGLMDLEVQRSRTAARKAAVA